MPVAVTFGGCRWGTVTQGWDWTSLVESPILSLRPNKVRVGGTTLPVIPTTEDKRDLRTRRLRVNGAGHPVTHDTKPVWRPEYYVVQKTVTYVTYGLFQRLPLPTTRSQVKMRGSLPPGRDNKLWSIKNV